MPKVALGIPNLRQTVERPVYLRIVRDLMEITRISSKTPINFLGPEDKAFQQGSTLGSEGLPENRWPFDERVFIEVEEAVDTDSSLTTPTYINEHAPVFMDTELGVYIRPIFAKKKVTISVKYRSTDLNRAQQWQNDIRTCMSSGINVNMHEINYSYVIPNAFLDCVEHIYDLRETVAGYGEELLDYFTKRLSPACGVVTNMSGESSVWAVADKQNRIQGMYDFDTEPERGSKESSGDTWTIGFNYTFYYQKPIECLLEYPLMVHQQLIDQKYIPTKAYTLEDQPNRFTQTGLAYHYFESDTRLLRDIGDTGVNIPEFDIFEPKVVLPTSVKVLQILVGLDMDNPKTLFNLADLGDYNFDPDVINFIKTSELSFIGKDFRSIISLSLYAGDYLMQSGSVHLDSDLNVVTDLDLDPRQVYRVRIGLVTDFSYLPVPAIKRLRENRTVAVKLIQAINGTLKGQSVGRTDIKKTELDDDDIILVTSKQFLPTYKRDSYIHNIISLVVHASGQGVSLF